MDIAMLVVMGGVAGTLAGLLGIGGGIVIVPLLAMLFGQQGLHPDVIMHSALGTSLATIVFTSASAARAHHRRDAVLWPTVARIAPGILIGAALGAAIADATPGDVLYTVFAVFMLVVAAQMAAGRQTRGHRTLPGNVGLSFAGLVIGSVASLFGIGGGVLSVPFLTWCNVPVRRAVASASALGFPIALSGSVAYLVAGLDESGLPAGSLGYIAVPAFAGIVLASTLCAPLGARLAHHIRESTLRRFFAVLLCVLALRMLLS